MKPKLTLLIVFKNSSDNWRITTDDVHTDSSLTTIYTLCNQRKNTASPKSMSLNQEHPSKEVFLAKPYKLEVMIIYLVKMIELDNFGHVTTSTI